MPARAILRLAAVLLLPLATPAAAEPILVGGTELTAQRLVTVMTAQLLGARGFEAQVVPPLGTAALRAALRNGEVDVVWEHTGTALTVFHHVRELPPREEVYDQVRELDAERGFVWLRPSAVDNGHALAMKRQQAEKHDIATLGDLAAAINGEAGLRLATTDEFFARPDGLKPLQTAYGFRFPRDHVLRMDADAIYEALAADQAELGVVLATDPRIGSQNLVLLEDDRGYFPPYQLVPVVREEVLTAAPALAEPLNELAGQLDNRAIRRMSAEVDLAGEPVAGVARRFLQARGLIE